MERFAGEVTFVAPDPRPVDGIIQLVGNATQLGVLAVVVVAAGALTLDAKPELAAYLRTKVSRPAVLLVPAYVVTAAAGYTRSQAVTVFGALGVLLLLPVVGIVEPIAAWLPSRLATAVAALLEGAPASEFARAAVTSVLATVALLALAAYRLERREL